MSTYESRGSAAFIGGSVTEALRSGGGTEGTGSVYVIRGDDGRAYRTDYTDIVTEGFRTLIVGNKVRFVPDEEELGLRAKHVLKVDEPPAEAYYTTGIQITPTEDHSD